MANPVTQVLDDVEGYSAETPPPAMGAQMAQQVQQGQMPRFNEQSIYAALQQEAAARQKREQAMMAQMQRREQEYAAQPATSNLEQAAMLMQVAGALTAPTKTGSFMESLGNAGTAVSGPLMQQAQAERSRKEKLLQLQMAREKMGMEMSSGNIGSAEMLKLYQLQQQKVQQPSAAERLMDRLRTEKDPTTRAAIRAQLSLEPEETPEVSARIPASVRDAGPEAIKAYRQEIGKKTAAEMSAALSTGDALSSALPILNRAEKAYSALDKAGGIGPYVGSGVGQAISKYSKTDTAKLREDYTAAQTQLQSLKARIEMKGQGAITDFERRLLALQLPTFDAQDPQTGLETLRLFRKEIEAAVSKPERIRARGTEEGEKKTPKVVDFGDLK
jgi:hypothetical protein